MSHYAVTFLGHRKLNHEKSQHDCWIAAYLAAVGRGSTHPEVNADLTLAIFNRRFPEPQEEPEEFEE